MRTAPIAKLKANLSRYVNAVRRGGEVVVTDRGVPVARLVGFTMPAASESDRARLARLARAGVIQIGKGDLSKLPPPIKVPGVSLSLAVIDDREDRS